MINALDKKEEIDDEGRVATKIQNSGLNVIWLEVAMSLTEKSSKEKGKIFIHSVIYFVALTILKVFTVMLH